MTVSLKFILETVESPHTAQSVKDQYYQKVIDARKSKPESLDYVGLNELHWAVVCNQVEKVSSLVKEKLCDINVGTSQSNSEDFEIHKWNNTPIMLATMHRNIPIIGILLDNGADLKIRRSVFIHMPGFGVTIHVFGF